VTKSTKNCSQEFATLFPLGNIRWKPFTDVTKKTNGGYQIAKGKKKREKGKIFTSEDPIPLDYQGFGKVKKKKAACDFEKMNKKASSNKKKAPVPTRGAQVKEKVQAKALPKGARPRIEERRSFTDCPRHRYCNTKAAYLRDIGQLMGKKKKVRRMFSDKRRTPPRK